LLDFEILGGRLALLYIHDVASRVEVRETDGRFIRAIDAPRFATIHTPVGAPDDDEAYFESESFTRPPETGRTSMRTGETSIWHATPIDTDFARFETEQLFTPRRTARASRCSWSTKKE